MANEFEPAGEARVATAIGPIEVALYDHDGDPAHMSASATVRVLDQDGLIMAKRKRSDDIRAHLTAAEKTQLKNIMDKIRATAATIILT